MERIEKKLKIAVVHDHLGFVGGGERTVLLTALGIGADFITAYANPQTFPEYQQALGPKLKVLSKRVITTRGVRFFWIRFLFRKNRKLFKDYDVVIVSGHSATDEAIWHIRKGATKILYVHNPPRRIYDQYESSKESYPWYLRRVFGAFIRFWRWKYLRAYPRFDLTIANSNHIDRQMRKYTGYGTNCVIWPPVITKNFKWIEQGNYFVSWARLDELKRVELIVSAFKEMPEEKLVVASSGPREEAVRALAKGYDNIRIAGWIEDEELFGLVGKARAALYIPVNEDAGLTHLEANAAGKPVICADEGGLSESTVDGETGILIREDPGKEDIIRAVKAMTGKWCLQKKEICEKHAAKYDESVFLGEIQKLIGSNDPNIPLLGIDASRWEDPRFPGEGRRTGVEVVAKNLIEKLVGLAEENNIRVRLYTPRLIKEFSPKIQKVIPGAKGWTRKLLARELKSSPPDYFFTPSFFIPAGAPEKSFSIIHDVIFKSDPSRYSFRDRLMQEFAARQNLKRSKMVFAVSNYTKNEILKYYRIRPEAIAVTPLGHCLQDKIDRTRKKMKTVLYIGRIEKKKSVALLVRAFARFSIKYPGWKLVLAGMKGFGYEEILSEIKKSGAGANIELPGFLSEEKKWELLASSSMLVHPSALEGSCAPLFEAWDAFAPAIVADSPVMKELGGNAALFFKPEDEEDLFRNMAELAGNENLGKTLVESGRNKLKPLSWENSAKTIFEAMIGIK